MRSLRPGLRGKLALSIALVLLVALGITYLAVYRGTGAELQNRTETELERESELLSTRLSRGRADGPAGYTARAQAIAASETFGPNARVISISIDGGGTATNQLALIGPGLQHEDPEGPRGGSDGSEDDGKESHEENEKRDNADRILGSRPGYSTVDIDDVGEVRLLTSEITLPGGTTATIRVGQPLAPVDSALEGLSDTFVIVGIATLLLGALAGWLLASSATRPMRRMASIAEGVDAGDLSVRMPIDGTRDEARRLARSFNGMLDRLEGAFDRQRAFVADASHDLRTPLTVVRGQIEVLARDPDPDADEVRRVSDLVIQAVTRMEIMVDDLLLLARSESPESLRLETVELGPLIAGEVEGLSFSSERDLISGPVTRREVDIDRDQVSRALSNLITNAIAHTAKDGRIEVSAREFGDLVSLTVDDDGPGVPPEDRERVFDRFARLDQARTSADGGSGLGLAIVKAIAEAHGGRALCGESPAGGARFEILLPARDDSSRSGSR